MRPQLTPCPNLLDDDGRQVQNWGPLLIYLLCSGGISPMSIPGCGAWLLGAWVEWGDLPPPYHCLHLMGCLQGTRPTSLDQELSAPEHGAQGVCSLESRLQAAQASGCLPVFLL